MSINLTICCAYPARKKFEMMYLRKCSTLELIGVVFFRALGLKKVSMYFYRSSSD